MESIFVIGPKSQLSYPCNFESAPVGINGFVDPDRRNPDRLHLAEACFESIGLYSKFSSGENSFGPAETGYFGKVFSAASDQEMFQG